MRFLIWLTAESAKNPEKIETIKLRNYIVFKNQKQRVHPFTSCSDTTRESEVLHENISNKIGGKIGNEIHKTIRQNNFSGRGDDQQLWQEF